MLHKTIRYLLAISLVTVSLCAHTNPNPESAQPEKTGFFGKLESGFKSVFNPELVDSVKSGAKRVFSSENVQKVKNWCGNHPGATLFGGALAFGGVFHKYKIGYLLAAGGMATGLVMELMNQTGMPLEQIFTKNQNPSNTPQNIQEKN